MSYPIPEALLERALLSDADLSEASLATKMLVARLRAELRADPAAFPAKMAELRAFFDKHVFAMKDIAAL